MEPRQDGYITHPDGPVFWKRAAGRDLTPSLRHFPTFPGQCEAKFAFERLNFIGKEAFIHPYQQYSETALPPNPSQRHGSTEWTRNLRTLPESRILRRVGGRILTNVMVACSVATAYYKLPSVRQAMGHVSPVPHIFLATIMSLVLVFRANAAHDRFTEGLKVWSRLINVSRRMARISALALPLRDARVVGSLIILYAHALRNRLQDHSEEEHFEELIKGIPAPCSWPAPDKQKEILKSAIGSEGAVASALEHSMRRNEDGAETAQQLFDVINGASNKPLEVIMQLGKIVSLAMEYKTSVKISHNNADRPSGSVSIEQEMIGQSLENLMDIMGSCARIVKSPAPSSWSVHTSQILSVWSLTLPFVLIPVEGYLSVPTVAVICWGLFSIEEIAFVLEDPFLEQKYSLPLDEFCATIEQDVLRQIMQ